MALSKDEVIKLASEFLELLCRKHNVRQAYLFGSFVKGQAKDYSDVDLAVVLGSSNRQEEPPFGEEFQVFHEAQKYSSLLETVCFDQDEFERDGGTLVRQIKKEGIRLI